MRKKRLYMLISRLGSMGIIIIMFAYFAIRAPKIWFTVYNFSNLLEQSVTLGLLAMGMTICRATGEMDMSVGSVLSLTSVVSMALAITGRPLWMCLAVGLACGLFVGIFNGFLRTVAGIPGIIPTIGTQGIVAGLALLYSGGVSKYGAGSVVTAFTRLGRGFPAISVLIVAVLVISFILARTKFGRYFYMVGGNAQTTELAGVNVNFVIRLAFILSALMAAAGGIMFTGRVGSGNPIGGADLLLDVIISVMIGSTVLTQEQEFTGLGSLIGAFFMTFVNSGMQITSQGYPTQCILRGSLFIVILALFSLQKKATE